LNKNPINRLYKEKIWRVMLHPSRVSAIISPRHDFERLSIKGRQDRQVPACIEYASQINKTNNKKWRQT